MYCSFLKINKMIAMCIYVSLIYFIPMAKASIPGTFFWKPRLGLDLAIPTTESNQRVALRNKQNIMEGTCILVDGYKAGVAVIGIAAGLSSASTYPHLDPMSAYFYTNVYRWALRYISLFAVTLKVFLCISLYVVYALCFYLAFDLVWFYLRRVHDPTQYWFWERVYRALLVVALVFLAGGLPINVVRIMGILGALTTTPAIFIYPPFINLLVNWEHPGLGPHNFRLITSICIMFLGFLLIIAGTYCNIVGAIRENS